VQNNYGGTALMIAATTGSPEVVQLLLDSGADAAIKDKGGKDALRWAAEARRPQAVQLLQQHAGGSRKAG
jgi:ankyrin repeat protein